MFAYDNIIYLNLLLLFSFLLIIALCISKYIIYLLLGFFGFIFFCFACFSINLKINYTLGSEATRGLVDNLKEFVDSFWNSGTVSLSRNNITEYSRKFQCKN